MLMHAWLQIQLQYKQLKIHKIVMFNKPKIHVDKTNCNVPRIFFLGQEKNFIDEKEFIVMFL